jgi:hypothetical protein
MTAPLSARAPRTPLAKQRRAACLVASALEETSDLFGSVDHISKSSDDLEQLGALDSSVNFLPSRLKLRAHMDIPVLRLPSRQVVGFIEKLAEPRKVVSREERIAIQVEILTGLIAESLEQRMKKPIVTVVVERERRTRLYPRLTRSDLNVDAHQTPA